MHFLLVPDLGRHWERLLAEGISAVIVALLMARLVHVANQRREAALLRMQVISEMNHHIRNALTAICLTAESIQNQQCICTRRTDGAAQAGGEPIGIGIPGLAPSLSFRATGFSTAPSAGVFIHRGGYIRLRSSGTDMDTVGMGTDTTTIISVQTPVTWVRVLIMWEDAVTHTASITERDPQEAVSIPELGWLAERAAPGDSVAVASMEAVAVSTAVVEGATVGER
jgi:type II secretory pathway pseudopilin PulG